MERTNNFSFIHGWLMNPRPPRSLAPSTRAYNCLDFLKAIQSMCPSLCKVDVAEWFYKGALFSLCLFFNRYYYFSTALIQIICLKKLSVATFHTSDTIKIHDDKHSTFLEQVAMLLISKKNPKNLLTSSSSLFKWITVDMSEQEMQYHCF